MNGLWREVCLAFFRGHLGANWQFKAYWVFIFISTETQKTFKSMGKYLFNNRKRMCQSFKQKIFSYSNFHQFALFFFGVFFLVSLFVSQCCVVLKWECSVERFCFNSVGLFFIVFIFMGWLLNARETERERANSERKNKQSIWSNVQLQTNDKQGQRDLAKWYTISFVEQWMRHAHNTNNKMRWEFRRCKM